MVSQLLSMLSTIVPESLEHGLSITEHAQHYCTGELRAWSLLINEHAQQYCTRGLRAGVGKLRSPKVFMWPAKV